MKKCLWIYVSMIIAFVFVGAASAYQPFPDTGQTKCYDDEQEIDCPAPGEPFYGQDAKYSRFPMSYTKLGNSGMELDEEATHIDEGGEWIMTRDNVTGLIWEIKHNRNGVKNYNNPHDADNTYTWYDPDPETNGGDPGMPGDGVNTFDTQQFINALNESNFGGFSDWRLPTFQELDSIVDYGISGSGPTVNKKFFPNTSNVHLSAYWSSTIHTPIKNSAWTKWFSYGTDNGLYKGNEIYVRAVRGPQTEQLEPFTINDDGTVTDTSSGLMWQQDTAEGSYTWKQALAYCENLDLGGHTDWRLPNIRELRRLVDYSRYAPAIDTSCFPKTFWGESSDFSSYWSSTTRVISDDSRAFYMNFKFGANSYHSSSYDKQTQHYVRAVRDIRSDQEFSGGDGTPENPYRVATAEDLNNVRNHLDAYFLQTADIDLGVAPWNQGEGWEPIGNDDVYFIGTFDGKDYRINGLFIDRPDEERVGLFSFIGEGASVSNMVLENVDVTGNQRIGGLVGEMKPGTITNCFVSGRVSGENNVVGGLVGYSTVGRFGSDDWKKGSILDSSFTGDVSGGSFVGGLVGLNSGGSIVKSYFMGNVSGEETVGGLAGQNGTSIVIDYGRFDGFIKDCYAVGDVSGGNRVGGLVGYNSEQPTVVTSYAAGSVWATETSVGGLIGYNVNSSLENNIDSFWDADVGPDTSQGGVGKTTTEMMQQKTFLNWDFDNVWRIAEGTTYPYLIYQTNATYTVNYNANEATSGTAPASQVKTHDIDLTLATNSGSLARIGYNFSGWNTSADGTGVDYAEGGNYTDNAALTLYAKLVIKQYTVTFEDHDGNELDTQTVDHGNSATAPADPVRDGYTFTGWDNTFDNITDNLTVTAQYTGADEDEVPRRVMSGEDQEIDITSDSIIIGTGASETLNIYPDINVDFTAGDGDQVNLPYELGHYEITSMGNHIFFSDADVNKVVTIIVTGTSIVGFADGSAATLEMVFTPGAPPQVQLGGAVVGSMPLDHDEVDLKFYSDTITNSIGMTFNYIEPGTFMMGSPEDELGRSDDETQHEVTLTQGYYMQTTPVTQGQWEAVMGDSHPWFSDCGSDCPAESVSWHDAQAFITALNDLEGTTRYALPTEAQWEYAARAGSTTAFGNGQITETGDGYDPVLDSMGWYTYNSEAEHSTHSSGQGTHPVAQKDPNAWGLYDMHGNVSEWVADWYGSYPSSAVTNPTGPYFGTRRVLRSGSWDSYARDCRSASRGSFFPGYGYGSSGWRLILLPIH